MIQKPDERISEIVGGVFPRHAEISERKQSGDLCLFVDWELRRDPARPNKRSRPIEVRISREAISDYANSNEAQRRDADARLAQHLTGRLASFDPEHDTPSHVPLTREQWVVSTHILNA